MRNDRERGPVRDPTMVISTIGVGIMAKESRVDKEAVARVKLRFEDEGLTTAQVADLLGLSKTQAHRVITKGKWKRPSEGPFAEKNAPKPDARLFTENPRAQEALTAPVERERVPRGAPAAQPATAPANGVYGIPEAPAGMTEWESRDWHEAECKKLLQMQNDRHAQELRVLQADFAAEARKPGDWNAARRQKTLAESTKIRHEMQRRNLEDWIRIKLVQLPVLAAGRGAVRVVVAVTPGYSIVESGNSPEEMARRVAAANAFYASRASAIDVDSKEVLDAEN
jgi:hypothetical protein